MKTIALCVLLVAALVALVYSTDSPTEAISAVPGVAMVASPSPSNQIQTQPLVAQPAVASVAAPTSTEPLAGEMRRSTESLQTLPTLPTASAKIGPDGLPEKLPSAVSMQANANPVGEEPGRKWSPEERQVAYGERDRIANQLRAQQGAPASVVAQGATGTAGEQWKSSIGR